MSSKGVMKSTKSAKARITFPVGRIHGMLRRGHFAPRIGTLTAVYLAAALEYLATEILELASDAAQANKKNMIGPRHILLAIRNDEELEQMLSSVTVSQGGVLPGINPILLPKNTMKSNR